MHKHLGGIFAVAVVMMQLACAGQAASDDDDDGTGSSTVTTGAGGAGGTAAGGGGSGGMGPPQPCPEPLGPDVFDPDSMFVVGTLNPGIIGGDLFCDINSTADPSAGFPQSWGPFAPAGAERNAYVRPTDCRLVFIYEQQVLSFRADSLNPYPQQPLANDVSVATPGCSNVDAFVMHPLTGALLYRCGQQWFDDSGSAFSVSCNNPTISAVSESGALLCLNEVQDAMGTLHPIAGVSSNALFVRRAKPGGGFWGVTRNAQDQFERWTITDTGVASLDGTYAEWPAGINPVNADVPGWGNIDRRGHFYRWGYGGEIGVDLIVRFEADFTTSAVVYDEATEPLCQLHAFNFVTSP